MPKFQEGSNHKRFIGRNAVRTRIEEGNRQLTLEFDELPAYDTWSIECRTDSLARTLSLSIEEVGHEQPKPAAGERRERDPTEKLRTLPAAPSHTPLTLSRDRDSAFEGGAFTPEGHWAVVATLLIGILPYSLYAYYRRPIGGTSRWSWCSRCSGWGCGWRCAAGLPPLRRGIGRA